MEDILEELVGEIWDEHDEVVEAITETDEGIYLVEGAISFDDFTEFFGFEEDEDIYSVSGWAAMHLCRMPQKGDSFNTGCFHVEITEAENHRVVRMKLTREN